MMIPPKMRKGNIWRGVLRGRSGGGSAVTVAMGTEDDIFAPLLGVAPGYGISRDYGRRRPLAKGDRRSFDR